MDEKRYDRRMNGKRVKQGVGFKGGIWLRFKSLRRQFQSVIFQFFFFNKSAKMSTILCFSVNMGCCVYINEEKT